MTNTKELILEIKRIKNKRGYSYGDIANMMKENGDDPCSSATFSRLFSDGSEDSKSFSYDYTLVPIARAILDTEFLEDEDDLSIKAFKELLQLKKERISELEQELDKEKIKRHEQLDEIRERNKVTVDFLRKQVEFKDKRMDMLLERVGILLERIEVKDARIDELTRELIQLKDIKDAVLNCPYRNGGEVNGIDSM